MKDSIKDNLKLAIVTIVMTFIFGAALYGVYITSDLAPKDYKKQSHYKTYSKNVNYE